MEPVQAGLFLAAFGLIAAGAVGLRMLAVALRRRDARHMAGERRAGAAEEFDLEDAVDRARGSTAWMRPDGGGF